MTTFTTAEASYYHEPAGAICTGCGEECEWPNGDEEPQCEDCRQREIRDNMSNFLDAPLAELAALVTRMQHCCSCGFEGDGREWREWARDLRASVPAICEALDDFAEELERERRAITMGQNIDRLTYNQQCLVALLMQSPRHPWTHSYMVEVRLDDATEHLLYGEHGLHVHAGNGSRCYTVHASEPDWAIVHVTDGEVRGWDWDKMAARGREIAEWEWAKRELEAGA